MAHRKRRANTTDSSHLKTKKTKFTLDNFSTLDDAPRGGVILATGTGDVGQLGLGPDVFEKARPALVSIEDEIVDVQAGGMHTVCLTKDGKVLTFGCNDEGALGRTTDGKEDAEFVAASVELPGRVIQVSAGDSHTAALLDDGRVFAWGTFRDSHGSMGLTVKGNEKLPYEIFPENDVRKIASGADHIVFLTKYGDVYTCGCAEQGQLGRLAGRSSDRHARGLAGKGQIDKLLTPYPITIKPTLKLHFDNVWASTYGTFAKVANKDEIYVCGLNNYGQLGLPKLVPQYNPILSKNFSQYKWKMIASSEHHTIALDLEGKTYAIGRKEYGRLGLGEGCGDASTLTEIPTLKDKKVVYVASGSSTSFAVTENGELYGWGMGTNGQLGIGEDDRLEPTLIKSKQLADKKVLKVCSGGQHTIILAAIENNNQDV